MTVQSQMHWHTTHTHSQNTSTHTEVAAELYMTYHGSLWLPVSQRNKNGVNCIYLKGSAEFVKTNFKNRMSLQIKLHPMVSECWAFCWMAASSSSDYKTRDRYDRVSEIISRINELKVNKSLRDRGGKWPTTNCDVKTTAGGHFGIRWKPRIVIK